jgi:DNA-binding FrmR family transcriptional regulator
MSDTAPGTIPDKRKLLNRVRRLRGQIDAIERALESEEPCGEIMQRLTAAKGAMNGLTAEVLSGHIRLHLFDADRPPARANSRLPTNWPSF